MGNGCPSLSLTGRPSSIGLAGIDGAAAARGCGTGGLKARFFNGGSPRFLVDIRLFSDMAEVRLGSALSEKQTPAV